MQKKRLYTKIIIYYIILLFQLILFKEKKI
jgi:hypothetical protein